MPFRSCGLRGCHVEVVSVTLFQRSSSVSGLSDILLIRGYYFTAFYSSFVLKQKTA